MSPPRPDANGQGSTPRLDSEPWSLDDAIAAAKAEATEVPFRFSHNGREYELPPIKQLPVRVQVWLANGETDQFLTEMLGQEAYDTLTEDLTVGGMEILFNEWARVNGVENQGNSSGPRRRASTRT